MGRPVGKLGVIKFSCTTQIFRWRTTTARRIQYPRVPTCTVFRRLRWYESISNFVDVSSINAGLIKRATYYNVYKRYFYILHNNNNNNCNIFLTLFLFTFYLVAFRFARYARWLLLTRWHICHMCQHHFWPDIIGRAKMCTELREIVNISSLSRTNVARVILVLGSSSHFIE